MKFAGKWMDLKNILSEVAPVTKGHMWYALNDKWMLAPKLGIPMIQLTDHMKLKKKAKVWMLQSFLEGETK